MSREGVDRQKKKCMEGRYYQVGIEAIPPTKGINFSGVNHSALNLLLSLLAHPPSKPNDIF
jgi:hypothetical protein